MSKLLSTPTPVSKLLDDLADEPLPAPKPSAKPKLDHGGLTPPARQGAAQAAELPPAPLRCLPLLWTKVLFPGEGESEIKIQWQALLWLLIVPAVLLYPCLDFHLFEPDEGRYAEIPREMLAKGEWVVPYLQGQPYLDKPPLMYWLVMLSYQALGVHDWSARLVPALAVHLTILCMYLIGRRGLGERPAFWGALLLGLAPGFLSVGRLLVLDGLLALWVTLGLLAALETVRQDFSWAWWLLAALACGLGVLTKGPVTLLLVLVPWLTYCWLAGRTTEGWKTLLAFASVVLLVAMPWYVLVIMRLPEFAGYFFWDHHVVRFLAPFDHLEPVWFYLPILLFGLLPTTIFLGHFLGFLLTGKEERIIHRSPELGYLLLAGGWCVLFFSLSGCKLPTYVLPAFPMLALALGYYLVTSGWTKSRWLPGLAGVSFVLLGTAHVLAVPWFAEFRSPLRDQAELTRLCGDHKTAVVCFPRNCDSVGFYLKRDDLTTFRSKDIMEMLEYMKQRERTVVLFTHRHSLAALKRVLPPRLRITEEKPLYDSARADLEGVQHALTQAGLIDGRESSDGLCYLAVIQRNW